MPSYPAVSLSRPSGNGNAAVLDKIIANGDDIATAFEEYNMQPGDACGITQRGFWLIARGGLRPTESSPRHHVLLTHQQRMSWRGIGTFSDAAYRNRSGPNWSAWDLVDLGPRMRLRGCQMLTAARWLSGLTVPPGLSCWTEMKGRAQGFTHTAEQTQWEMKC